ncbi:condensation domain-containing protein [Streptomyces sp. NPDC059604]|uniref:condensation domain-containing protein n=3 Tax=unclassified Streptomyces TaxID=2593676 RepID=UPI0036A02205
MTTNAIERICRLTPLQDGMFFEALRRQGTSEVVYQVCLELTGELDAPALREAWRAAARRHPILRTSFHYERLDAPVQVAHREAEAPWQEHDLSGMAQDGQQDALAKLLETDRAASFDLTRAPLMRLALVRAGEGRAWLVWTYHHLLLDGWSTYLVLADVFDGYRAAVAGGGTPGPAPRPYWEYVAWLQARDEKGEEEYWRRRLAGFRAPTPIGFETVEPQDADAEFGEAEFFLSPRIKYALEDLVRTRHLTLGSIVQAAWALTLARYSGHDDVVFGSIVSGRTPDFAGIDDIVGLFINVLPVRAVVDDEMSLADWLARFQEQLVEARQYESSPLAAVQRWSEVPRGLPLFESLAVFINYPVRENWTDGGAVQVTGSRVLQQPHYPLHLTAVPADEGWRLSIGYDPRRFRPGTVQRLGRLLTSVFAAIVDGVTRPVGELPRWTATVPLADQATAAEFSPASPAELLSAVAARRPTAPAVDEGGRRTDYRSLFQRADALDGRLRAAGAGSGRTVRIRLAPSTDLVVAVVAAIGTGAAVELVDPAAGGPAPDADDNGPVVGAGLLVEAAAGARDPADDGPATVRQPTAPVIGGYGADGLVLTRAGFVEALYRLQCAVPLGRGDRVALLGGGPRLLRNLLWTLAAGAAVVFDAEANVVFASGEGAARTAAGRLPARDPEDGTTHRLIVDGVVSSELRADLAARTGVEFVEEHRGGPVGLLVSPSWSRPVDVGPVARRAAGPRVFPDTAETPVDEDAWLWPTAAVLERHTAVREAAVRLLTGTDGVPVVVAFVVIGQGEPTATELEELVASHLPRAWVPGRFVVLDALPSAPDGTVDRSALVLGGGGGSRVARSGSPADQLAEVVTGIWAQALDLPPGESTDEETDFFDHGGHSLLAIKLVSRLRSALRVEFTLNHLFTAPTLGGVVRAVRALLTADSGAGVDAPIPRAPRDRPLAASFAQERMWFLDRLGGPPENVMLPSRVDHPLDPEVLRRALAALASRHEVLGSCLREVDGRVVQVPQAEPAVPLEVVDLTDLPLDAAEEQARTLLAADAARPFDLGGELPLRVRLIRLAPADHVLGVCLHHAVMDGWSTGVLFNDLNTLYRAEATGTPAGLPELTAQYADFSAWQRERLSGERLDRLLDHWRGRLDGAPDLLALDGRENGRVPGTERAGDMQEVFLGPDVATGLRSLAGSEAATVSMAMLSVCAAMLARHAGRPDVVVGLAVAGRDHPQLEGLVGFFVNTLPVRIDLSDRPTFRTLLKRVRETVLDALAHQELPIEKLVTVLRPDRAADRLPLVQVQYTFQSAPFRPLEFGGRTAGHFPVRQESARFELNIEVYEWRGGIRCVLHHDRSRYRPEYVRRLAEECADLVRVAVADPDTPVDAAGGTPPAQPLGSLDLLRSIRSGDR